MSLEMAPFQVNHPFPSFSILFLFMENMQNDDLFRVISCNIIIISSILIPVLHAEPHEPSEAVLQEVLTMEGDDPWRISEPVDHNTPMDIQYPMDPTGTNHLSFQSYECWTFRTPFDMKSPHCKAQRE